RTAAVSSEGVRPARVAGAASRPCFPAERAARPRVGLRLPRIHADGRRPRPAGAREADVGEGHRSQHPDGLGRRVPVGAGRKLNLRLRLLAAAAGIVAISLLLAGALTWVFVRDLEFQSVQDQLDREAISAQALVRHQECLFPTGVATNVGPAGCRLVDPAAFQERVAGVAPSLNGNRLLLLDRQHRVVFDSASVGTYGDLISVTASKRVANVGEARASLDGQPYFAAAAALAPARDPLGAAFVVVAQPQSLAATAAAGDLATRLLEAGGVALVVAMLLMLLVSQSVTSPVTQLAQAAEYIAAGN